MTLFAKATKLANRLSRVKVLDHRNEDIGTQIHLQRKSWRHRVKNPYDVNSLFTSVFMYECLHFPGQAL